MLDEKEEKIEDMKKGLHFEYTPGEDTGEFSARVVQGPCRHIHGRSYYRDIGSSETTLSANALRSALQSIPEGGSSDDEEVRETEKRGRGMSIDCRQHQRDTRES